MKTKLCEIGLRKDQVVASIEDAVPAINAVGPETVVYTFVVEVCNRNRTDKAIGLYRSYDGKWHMLCPSHYFDHTRNEPDGFCHVSTEKTHTVLESLVCLDEIMNPLEFAIVFEETEPGVWRAITE